MITIMLQSFTLITSVGEFNKTKNWVNDGLPNESFFMGSLATETRAVGQRGNYSTPLKILYLSPS